MTTREYAILLSTAAVSAFACGPQSRPELAEREVTSAAIAGARSLLVAALGQVDSVILAQTRVGFDDYQPVASERASPPLPIDTVLVREVLALRYVDASCVSPVDCGGRGGTGLVVLTAVQMKGRNQGVIRLLLWARQSHVVYELEFERVGTRWIERRREQLLVS